MCLFIWQNLCATFQVGDTPGEQGSDAGHVFSIQELRGYALCSLTAHLWKTMARKQTHF